MKTSSSSDRIPAIIAGILVGGLLILGHNDINKPINNTNTIDSGLRGYAKPKYNYNNQVLVDTLSVNGRNNYRYWFEIVTQAEDEYWEVEHIDGKYYKVRREDWDDIDGYYEITLEEPIGNTRDLIEYARSNQAKRVHTGL